MIHILMKEKDSVCFIQGVYANQEAAYWFCEVENLVPTDGESWYVTSYQIDEFDNEEGIEFGEELKDCPPEIETIFLVVEKDNPSIPGVLPTAAFTDKSEAEQYAERKNCLGFDNIGKLIVEKYFVFRDKSPMAS